MGCLQPLGFLKIERSICWFLYQEFYIGEKKQKRVSPAQVQRKVSPLASVTTDLQVLDMGLCST